METRRIVSTPAALLIVTLLAANLFAFTDTVWVSTRDGRKIKTHIHTPSGGSGPWPVVFKKGYNIRTAGSTIYPQRGFVYVAQGVRPGGDPHGISGDARFFADDRDGYDAIDWISRQSWCNGQVVMQGESYFGATQWLAAANEHPGPHPALKAINPSSINPDFWQSAYRCNGAMNFSMAATSRALSSKNKYADVTFKNFMRLPLADIDKQVQGIENTLWNEYSSHWYYQSPGRNGKPYWPKIGMRDRYRNIKIPVYIFAGWWDYYAGASLKYYNLMKALGHTQEIRIWIDNCGHMQMDKTEHIKWLNWILRKKSGDMEKLPPVRLFVQGANENRWFEEWPPKGTQFVPYYFSSPSGAKNGSLSMNKPAGNETPTVYKYDPANPVPSVGGNANHRMSKKTLSSGAILKAGSFDQRSAEKRQDVLVFSTSALQKDLTVIGPVKIKLWAKSDAKDTDFTAVLCDVLPDGKVMNVTEGIVRARFRESIWETPKLITPNQIYEYKIELQPTARVFKKGHKIRVHLSSSRFPLWDRNLNTGNDPHTDTQWKIANQTIFHDKDHPTQIILPLAKGSVGFRPRKRVNANPEKGLRVQPRGNCYRIELPASGGQDAKVSIYSIQGARMADLGVANHSGKLLAEWNASRQARGVYLIRAIADGKAFSRKIFKGR